MSTPIASKIREAVSWHTSLHGVLAETGHAPAALRQQASYVADVEHRLSRLPHEIKMLDFKRQKELREHESYRDSHFKKFAYKVGGKSDKFEKRQDKEEEEYHQVLEDLNKANNEQANLQSLLSDAIQQRTNLEQQAQRATQAQHDLDRLYEDIFGAPTPDFPVLEAAKHRTAEASSAHDARAQRARADEDLVKRLGEVRAALERAFRHIESALSHSQMDMIGFDMGGLADLEERRALDRATAEIGSANGMVEELRRANPGVRPLRKVQIHAGNLVSDMVFDNIFTDMAFHDKIKASREELLQCMADLNAQLADATTAQGQSEQQRKDALAVLEAAKAEMQSARKRVFDDIAAGGDGGAGQGAASELASNNPYNSYNFSMPPPAYQQ